VLFSFFTQITYILCYRIGIHELADDDAHGVDLLAGERGRAPGQDVAKSASMSANACCIFEPIAARNCFSEAKRR